MYFLFHISEDGDLSIEKMNKDELLSRINENYYGDISFHYEIPEESDPNYWEKRALIIKGRIVFPKPVQLVEKYEIQ